MYRVTVGDKYGTKKGEGIRSNGVTETWETTGVKHFSIVKFGLRFVYAVLLFLLVLLLVYIAIRTFDNQNILDKKYGNYF